MVRPPDQKTTVPEKTVYYSLQPSGSCIGVSQEAGGAGERMGQNLPYGFRGKGKMLEFKQV